MGHSIFVVDVFAERQYAGNQLAVVIAAGDLTTAQMQEIARETHFSETTFVLANEPGSNGWPVRIFTPAIELPFAGHPTLGTAWVIRRELLGLTREPCAGEELVLDLKIGSIPVRFEIEEEGPPVPWMRQQPPTFGEEVDGDAVAAVLGLGAADLDPRFPVREVSTGVPFLIVPVATLEAVQRGSLDIPRYRALIEPLAAKSILFFCPQTLSADNDLHARVFAEFFGVPEDPATGSANGCLAAYLAAQRYWGTAQIEARVEQGYEIDRPSLLRLRADATSEPFKVEVGGRVFPSMRGRLED